MDGFRLNRKRTRLAQTLIKTAILILATYYAVIHQLKGILGAPPIHAFCPFGGLESLFKLVASGTYIDKIFPATMVLFVATIFMAVLLRRGFCGWVCPLGLLQEFFTRLGRKLKLKQNTIPRKIDSYLKYTKYIGLVLIIYFTWKTSTLVFAPYDPWVAYGHLLRWPQIYNEFLIGLAFFAFALFGSLWLTQNWCKYFCPMGALLALPSSISPTKIVRDEAVCINCKKCTKICPVSIEVSETKKVTSFECYQCGDCLSVCPAPGALEYKTIKNRKMSWLVYGIVAILIFFGSVYSAKAVKIWKAGYPSAHHLLKDETGNLNPYNIRGSMSLEDVSRAFDIPISYITDELGLPEEIDKKAMLKDLMKTYPFRMGQVKRVVAGYLSQKNSQE